MVQIVLVWILSLAGKQMTWLRLATAQCYLWHEKAIKIINTLFLLERVSNRRLFGTIYSCEENKSTARCESVFDHKSLAFFRTALRNMSFSVWCTTTHLAERYIELEEMRCHDVTTACPLEISANFGGRVLQIEAVFRWFLPVHNIQGSMDSHSKIRLVMPWIVFYISS